MKIVDVRVFNVETQSAPATRLQQGWLFVRVETDEGIVGLGEASHGGNEVVRAYLEGRLRTQLIGRDPRGIEPLATEMLASAHDRGAATAVSAVEQALWDIWGQSIGVPIWKLLGGRHRDRVQLYANVNRATFDRSPEGFARSARAAVGDGFRAVKCAPFDDVMYRTPDRDANRRGVAVGLERIARIREAIGPDVRLMVDCHSRFDVPTAIQVVRELEPLKLTWLEEPVPEADLDGLERIRDHAPMPIAGGEALIGRSGFWETVRRRVVDVIMPDVKHCGGILETRKIAAMAEPIRLSIAPHNPSGPISTFASVHVCATIPNFLILEYPWGEATWRRDLVTPPEVIEDGAIAVPERPGLGIQFDEDVLREHLASH